MEYLGEFWDRGKKIITQCKCCKGLMYMKVGDFENNRRTVCSQCLSNFPSSRGHLARILRKKYFTKSRRLLAYNGDV